MKNCKECACYGDEPNAGLVNHCFNENISEHEHERVRNNGGDDCLGFVLSSEQILVKICKSKVTFDVGTIVRFFLFGRETIGVICGFLNDGETVLIDAGAGEIEINMENVLSACDEVFQGMDRHEQAVKLLKEMYATVNVCLTSEECRNRNAAIKMAIKALEMQIPQEPIIDRWVYTLVGGGKCPQCGEEFSQYPMFCDRCGQAIDWK